MTSLFFHNDETGSNAPFSQLKLTFEGPNIASGKTPLEFVIPLPRCSFCQRSANPLVKRPFVFTTTPFPFDLSQYPATTEAWSKLSSDVYGWLKETIKDRQTDEWKWAVNFFWISYLGSAPHFPAAVNTAISWDPDIVPISGEFINSRTLLLAMGQYVARPQGAQLIARLVEWMQLREKWIMQGVDIDEYQRRISAHEDMP